MGWGKEPPPNRRSSPFTSLDWVDGEAKMQTGKKEDQEKLQLFT